MKKVVSCMVIVLLWRVCAAQSYWNHGRLQVTGDGHYLQFSDGTPFFWLGNTGWQIFQRLKKEEVATCLEKYFQWRQAIEFQQVFFKKIII